MPLIKEHTCTSKDYWNLPEDHRAELIGGKLYNMAPPSRIHQRISGQLYKTIANFIDEHHGECQIYASPFAVNLDAEDQDWVEPDLSVICDSKKLTERGCSGAPDLIIEIVSPGSRRMDYLTKSNLYQHTGVREYWIVDPQKQCTTHYHFEEDAAPAIIPFSMPVLVRIFDDLSVTISELL